MSKPAICKFTPFLRRCRVACEPERHSTQESGRHLLRCKKKNAKMTVETVEIVVAAAPFAALIGHKLRPLLSDSQSALAGCEEDVIQRCHLLSRNGTLSLVRLTMSFPTIPNLISIVNALIKMTNVLKSWSVMLLCTIYELQTTELFRTLGPDELSAMQTAKVPKQQCSIRSNHRRAISPSSTFNSPAT